VLILQWGALLGKAAQSYLRKDPHPDPLVRDMEPRIRGSGSVPKFNGSATLVLLFLIFPVLMLQWGAVLGKAAQSYLRKLWNGACFSFDESPRGSDVIMADQLAGYWYMRLGGASAPPSLWHAEKVHSALRLIFEHNVQKFAGGKLGENKLSKDYTKSQKSLFVIRFRHPIASVLNNLRISIFAS
jgi:hypothetical protein